jgi:hypothetical protein
MAYIGKTPVIGNFQVCDAISVVNNQAAYTMQVGGVNVSPESANHMLVSLNGILQAPTSSFTVSGSTITFASNLVTGDVIDFIQILGNVLDLGVPSDNTVTTAKLSDSSVSLAKLTATGTKDATTFLRGDNTFAAAGLDGWSSSSGNLLPASASAGIYLGVNSATAANLLDDYEEGTWTPTFIRSSSTISNVTVSKAHYTKIGRMVYISASTQYTGSDLTGVAIVGAGLPFTSAQGNSLGVTGGYIHDPGSGNTNYQAGIAGSHDSNDNFYLIITPGGRYFDTWRQNFYLSFGFWYFV